MGTFQIGIELGDSDGNRFHSLQALVDTGSTYLVVPRDQLAPLGYQPMEKRPFALADDRVVDYEIGVVLLRLNGRALPMVCVFGDEGTEPLLGAVALETFLLAANPVNERLVPVGGKLK